MSVHPLEPDDDLDPVVLLTDAEFAALPAGGYLQHGSPQIQWQGSRDAGDGPAALRIAPGTPGTPAQILRSITSPAITPAIITDLLTFGRARVESGEAAEALRAAAADIPDFVASYRLGFLPKKVSAALSRDAKHATAGLRLGNTLIVPAFDDQGIAVDLLTVFATGKVRLSLFDEPRGLLAPEVLHRGDDLVITDSFSVLVQFFRDGHRNVLLVRGAADATANAARIAAAGVKLFALHARKGANQIADTLRAAVLEVVRTQDLGAAPDAPPVVVAPIQFPAAVAPTAAPAPTAPPTSLPAPASASVDPNPPIFVEEEAGEVAIFQAASVRYSVTMRTDGVTKRRVVIRANGKSCAHDLDLAVPAARERTAGNAARQVGLPPATIAAHLIEILAGVQAREEARLLAPAVALSSEERDAGAAFLADPHLLDRVTADLGALGWIGEERTKVLLYLVSVSRLLPQPLWAVYRSTGGAAPWQALACISALTPPEVCTQHHRVTDAAINQADPTSLRHHLLVIDQAETVRPEAAVTLRILKERGGVGMAGAEARGPVAVLAAAAGDIDHRCRDCFMMVSVDDSPEQTARIIAEQSQRLGAPAATVTTQAAVAARHHAAQRLLERMPVSIPFANRIAFPSASPRHRAEHASFLSLIAASALLHQRQRRRENNAVIAAEADFHIAARMAKGLLGVGGDGLSRAARDLVAAVERAGLAASFTMADLPAVMPDATRWTLRAALQELSDFGYVESPRAGRGRLRGYHLNDSAAGIAAGTVGIRLREIGDVVGQVGGLAEVGGIGAANLKRSAV